MRAGRTSRSHHGRRSWRGAPAQRGPERGRLATAATAPHGFHPTFATVAVQQSAGAAGAFECARSAGRLPVLFRAARQRARTRVSREDSAIVIGVSCSNFNSTRWPVGGLPPSCRATPHHRHPASGRQLRVRKTLPRLARVMRRSGAAAQPPETATRASIRARDLAANSRGFLNQPNAAGGRKNRGSGLVRAARRRGSKHVWKSKGSGVTLPGSPGQPRGPFEAGR